MCPSVEIEPTDHMLTMYNHSKIRRCEISKCSLHALSGPGDFFPLSARIAFSTMSTFTAKSQSGDTSLCEHCKNLERFTILRIILTVEELFFLVGFLLR